MPCLYKVKNMSDEFSLDTLKNFLMEEQERLKYDKLSLEIPGIASGKVGYVYWNTLWPMVG